MRFTQRGEFLTRLGIIELNGFGVHVNLHSFYEGIFVLRTNVAGPKYTVTEWERGLERKFTHHDAIAVNEIPLLTELLDLLKPHLKEYLQSEIARAIESVTVVEDYNDAYKKAASNHMVKVGEFQRAYIRARVKLRSPTSPAKALKPDPSSASCGVAVRG